MNFFIIAGGALGLYLFYPLCKSILKSDSEQNALTFFLWSTLDTVSAVTTWDAGGKYLQAALIAFGGFITFGCILKAGGLIKWRKFEVLVLLMFIFCIEIWILIGPVVAAAASLCALVISSLPQMADTWEHPEKTPTWIYFGSAMSGLIATFGGKEITVIEVGYSFLGFVICSIIALLSLRHFFRSFFRRAQV